MCVCVCVCVIIVSEFSLFIDRYAFGFNINDHELYRSNGAGGFFKLMPMHAWICVLCAYKCSFVLVQ